MKPRKVSPRDERLTTAEAEARALLPDVDRVRAFFYSGQVMLEAWKGKSARIYLVIGEEV